MTRPHLTALTDHCYSLYPVIDLTGHHVKAHACYRSAVEVQVTLTVFSVPVTRKCVQDACRIDAPLSRELFLRGCFLSAPCLYLFLTFVWRAENAGQVTTYIATGVHSKKKRLVLFLLIWLLRVYRPESVAYSPNFPTQNGEGQLLPWSTVSRICRANISIQRALW
jgi:hypothetical protein